MTSLGRWVPAWVRRWLVGLALFVAGPALAQEIPEGWMTIEAEHLRLHTPPRHERLVRALAAHADPRVPEIGARLGLPIGGPIDVFLASSDAEFRRVQPGDPPPWADATAYPGLGVVYLRAPTARGGDNEPLTTVLDHELVHIVVGRAFAPNRAPTWLQEGLAQLHAGQHDLASVRKLSAAAFGGPIPLSELERAFPRNPHAASLAYAQSVDFLAWLERTYGQGAVAALVDAMRRGESLELAILGVTGQPLSEVDRAWSARLSGWSLGAWQILGGQDFMWLVAALVGLAAMFIVRRRQRQRRAVIRSRERRDGELLDAFVDRFGRVGSDAPRLPYRDASAEDG